MSEQRVAHRDDLHDGEMMQAVVAGTEVLLIRHAGRFFAIGATCPHHGAPLSEGTLENGRLTCPWHASVFDITTGDLIEPPTLDGLARFEVRVDDEGVYVRAPEQVPKARTMSMARRDPSRDDRLFAIVGGGAAAESAAESLRQCGYRGRILMISQDVHRPYDRTYASKQYLAGQIGDHKMPLRDEEFYREYDLEWLQGTVVALDVQQRVITLADGERLLPDAILLASGGVPRTLDVPGAELPGILTLRTWEDSRQIRDAAHNAERVVIVGASFIGLEVAAALADHELILTVTSPESVPFERKFGREIGLRFQRLHEQHRTRFRMGHAVRAFLGDQHVRHVELDDGSRLDADLVILGLGVRPATGFLVGVELNEDGSVNVDQDLRLAEGVYAAGDVVRYPDPFTGQRVRIEHWRLAQQHGRTAGQRMVQWGRPFASVPFFWTRHFGETFDYAGYAADWDEVIITGDLGSRQFSAYYAQADRLLAVLSTESGQVAHFMEQMRIGRLPTAGEIRPFVSNDPAVDLLRAAAMARV